MYTAHFAKVTKSMTWISLKENIINQKKNTRKQLPFIVSSEIWISSSEFDKLSSSIHSIDKRYLFFTQPSAATPNGIWQCILIKCTDDPRNILIYTAENITPLYASILNPKFFQDPRPISP